MKIKPSVEACSLAPVAAGTALVLVTYVTPMATLTATVAGLRAGVAAGPWLLNSMSIGLAAGLLAAGVVGDNVGRRRVYVTGLVAMALGAVACGVAWSAVGFVAGRVLGSGRCGRTGLRSGDSRS